MGRIHRIVNAPLDDDYSSLYDFQNVMFLKPLMTMQDVSKHISHEREKGFIPFWYYDHYSGELHTYGTNLKWIWILNSLYFKIRVNKNSHRFVIIKLQDIFGTSKNAFTWKFWPFCFVFISLKNVKRHCSRNLSCKQTQSYWFFKDFSNIAGV